jgi:hypothetical protein
MNKYHHKKIKSTICNNVSLHCTFTKCNMALDCHYHLYVHYTWKLLGKVH